MSGTSSPSEPGANGSVFCGVSLPCAGDSAACGKSPLATGDPVACASVMLAVCSSATMRPLSCDCFSHPILPNEAATAGRNVSAPQKPPRRATSRSKCEMMWQKWATQSRTAICIYETAGKRHAGISSTLGLWFLPHHFDSTICAQRMERVQSRGKPAKMAPRVPFSMQGAPDNCNARHVLRARRSEKRSMMALRGSAHAPVALGVGDACGHPRVRELRVRMRLSL